MPLLAAAGWLHGVRSWSARKIGDSKCAPERCVRCCCSIARRDALRVPRRCIDRPAVLELLEDELLIQTSWKSALCVVLVVGSVAACSDTETGSHKSSNTSTDIENLRDAA